jgi:predicted transcriptional regulator of viral defense system
MPKQTRLSIAKKDIFSLFDDSPKKVYSLAELARIVTEHRTFWRLARKTNARQFVQFLIEQKRMTQIDLRSAKYATQRATRYLWDSPTPYAVALSIRKNAYLSHGTAVFLHGLNDLIPKTIYLNAEQSAKPAPKGNLTQAGIDRAFSNQQRQSSLSYAYGDQNITVINGKQSERLGVEKLPGPEEEELDVTGIERTLIDIAVRPTYSGGVNEVLAAYRSAKSRVSINRLIVMLKKLDYVYPFHQAIGFYLERAGYEPSRYESLRALGLNFDFYLTYGLKKPKYDEAWRIYYPEGLSSAAS